MSIRFNYRHLYYFWVVAKEGGVSRAADRLGMAVQTISTQVRELEHSLGCALLKPSGRGLVLTDAGRAAMQQAELIFQLGEDLPGVVNEAGNSIGVRLSVGISDGIPKLVVHRLLAPVLEEVGLRLLCHDGELDDLLGELALHRLDMVIADRPAPANPSMKLYSHAVASSPVAWYAAPELHARALDDFPRSLARVPVLLPTGHNVLRARLDHWFDQHGIRPRINGEFEDSALLKTFGASGMGVFPAVTMVDQDMSRSYHVKRLGDCETVDEQFFVITSEKKVQHRLVQRLTLRH